ncbi:MAG: hypothetical protein NW220_07945 [Leptolyngbyaceae cyanobacterium bins.349]|nr:hypothetical protein [Leptolyngbyaceae cyanobacterium bins.349]
MAQLHREMNKSSAITVRRGMAKPNFGSWQEFFDTSTEILDEVF